MAKYRIYALIHGEILPEGKIFDCEIKKMSFTEQKKRKFSPIQSIFSKGQDLEYHKTYATFLPYVDPVRIRSKYIVVCDIEEDKESSALGGAIRKIDRLCRFLSIAYVEDAKKKFNRERFGLLPYLYQVNKIYLLDATGNEIDTNFKLESGFVYLPDRPELSKWRDKNTQKFLEDIFNFHDEVLERAIKYLYRSAIGRFISDSPEKIALDHFKSIEIIVKSLSKTKRGKRKATFKERLEETGNKINLTPQEKQEIEKFWEDRSKYGDVAHPSPFDEVERYPNQFPIPSNVRYSGGGFDSVAASIILKYFQYIKGVFIIDIDEPSSHAGHDIKEGTFNRVYSISLWGTAHHNHLVFYSSEKNKHKLKQQLKSAFSKEYGVPEESIVEVVLEPGRNGVLRRRRFKLRVCMTN